MQQRPPSGCGLYSFCIVCCDSQFSQVYIIIQVVDHGHTRACTGDEARQPCVP